MEASVAVKDKTLSYLTFAQWAIVFVFGLFAFAHSISWNTELINGSTSQSIEQLSTANLGYFYSLKSSIDGLFMLCATLLCLLGLLLINGQKQIIKNQLEIKQLLQQQK